MVETMGACISMRKAVEEENPREQHITPRIMPVVKGGVLPIGDGAVRGPADGGTGGDSLF